MVQIIFFSSDGFLGPLYLILHWWNTNIQRPQSSKFSWNKDWIMVWCLVSENNNCEKTLKISTTVLFPSFFQKNSRFINVWPILFFKQANLSWLFSYIYHWSDLIDRSDINFNQTSGYFFCLFACIGHRWRWWSSLKKTIETKIFKTPSDEAMKQWRWNPSSSLQFGRISLSLHIHFFLSSFYPLLIIIS